MSTTTIVLLVILAILIVGVIVLYFLGKKSTEKTGRTTGTNQCSKTNRFHADYR